MSQNQQGAGYLTIASQQDQVNAFNICNPNGIPDLMMEAASSLGMVSVVGRKRALSQYGEEYTVYRNGAAVPEGEGINLAADAYPNIFEVIGLWRDTLRENIAVGRRVIVWRREPEFGGGHVSWRLHFLDDSRVFEVKADGSRSGAAA